MSAVMPGSIGVKHEAASLGLRDAEGERYHDTG